MSASASSLGFIAILMLYFVVGLTSVAGAIAITRRLFSPRVEQIGYGLFLVAIAAFYLAFVAYFGEAQAWEPELRAVLVFTVLGLLGTRLPLVLVLGYLLHGVWDGLHEWQAHGSSPVFEPGQSTQIPLAYGVFCATFDVGMAVYFLVRRQAWNQAWRRGR